MDIYQLYVFLNRNWISKPSDYDEIDPEIKAGLLTILEMESKKAGEEESKMKAQETLNKMRGRSNI